MMSKELLEQIKDAIAHELGLTDDYRDGTYLYHLTRSKSAFAVGTMTLDDFKEVDEELLDNIFNVVKPFFIEQAERIQELEEKVDKLKVWYVAYRRETKTTSRLREENERFRETLEFYADKDNYKLEYFDPNLDGLMSEVDYDEGQKARKALEGVKMELPKYRAWDYTYKKMWKVVAMSEPTYDDREEPYIKVCEFDRSPMDKEADIRFLFNFDLMPFTGLYDKNRKEIYKGDIVEVKLNFSNKIGRYVVEYNEYGEWVIGTLLLSKHFQFCEVIGNIYENPELLE